MNRWEKWVLSCRRVLRAPTIAQTNIAHELFDCFCRLPGAFIWGVTSIYWWVDDCVKIPSYYDWAGTVSGDGGKEIIEKGWIISIWAINIANCDQDVLIEMLMMIKRPSWSVMVYRDFLQFLSLKAKTGFWYFCDRKCEYFPAPSSHSSSKALTGCMNAWIIVVLSWFLACTDSQRQMCKICNIRKKITTLKKN